MIYKYYIFSFILASFFLNSTINAFSNSIESANIGFPAKNIWLSKSSVLEGDEVLIHTFVMNDFDGTFSGRMQYYDKKENIGEVEFTVASSQKIKIVSLLWTATAGSKLLSAKIVDSKIIDSNKKEHEINLPISMTSELVLVVLADNNKNGIPDTDEVISTSTLNYADSEIFNRGIKKAKNVIPKTVKTGIKGIFSYLDSFRVNSHDSISSTRIENISRIDVLDLSEIKSKISTIQSASSTINFDIKEHAERPLRYVYWLVLVILAEIFNRSWLFYIFVFAIVYVLVRYLWGKIRGR